MLTEICAEIRNYFPVEKRHGEFTISGGSIAPLDFLRNGQHFRIVGSVFNDGVHQFPADDLKDEKFTGEVWAMAVPPTVIALANTISEYEKKNAGNSGFVSESFAGYSYTRATDENGCPASWQKVFSAQLNKFRRVSV